MNANEFNRLERAFEQASRITGQERTNFVDKLSRNDPDLALELRTLLDHHDRESDPLEAVYEAHRRAVASAQPAESSAPEIAGYQVAHQIGRGGQADVFLAHQQSTGQAVAVKIFRGSGLTDTQRHRIDAETQALVRLRLPNVVPILDRGVTDCGREYLITQFVAGRPIDEAASDLFAENPRQILQLFAGVADTLGRVHREGIIHRDLKPSNILVDRDGEPYLLDFGLASFFADPSGRLLTASSDNLFCGSILWASPEQVDASFGTVDQRSDIYSLGVVLYQALTGRFPYPVEGGILGVAQEIVRTRPNAVCDPAAKDGGLITDAMEHVVFRTLEKRPDRRFQTAAELATALRTAPSTDAADNAPAHQVTGTKRAWLVTGIGGAAIATVLLVFAFANQPADPDHNSETAPDSAYDGALQAENSQQPAAPSPDELVSVLDEALLPFGEVPQGWTRIGELQNDSHEIERENLRIGDDFILRLTLSADRSEQAAFALMLVGDDASSDLRINGTKTNTWSDNETWIIQTPSGPARVGLPLGEHVFTLKREGERLTFSVDAVYRPEHNSSDLAIFATGDSEQFQGIRLSTDGPGLRLAHLRLHTGNDP